MDRKAKIVYIIGFELSYNEDMSEDLHDKKKVGMHLDGMEIVWTYTSKYGEKAYLTNGIELEVVPGKPLTLGQINTMSGLSNKLNGMDGALLQHIAEDARKLLKGIKLKDYTGIMNLYALELEKGSYRIIKLKYKKPKTKTVRKKVASTTESSTESTTESSTESTTESSTESSESTSESEDVKRRKTSKTKKLKDPHAPKKLSTPYVFYVSDVRSKTMRRNPNLSFGELSQKIAEDWKRLPSVEKDHYTKLADEDKERYEREMKKYELDRKSKKSRKESSSTESSSESEEIRRRKTKKLKDMRTPKKSELDKKNRKESSSTESSSD